MDYCHAVWGDAADACMADVNATWTECKFSNCTNLINLNKMKFLQIIN